MIDAALRRVEAWFGSIGCPVRDLLDRVVIHETPLTPDSVAGYTEGRALHLVTEPIYRRIWDRLYPTWPWTDDTYAALARHEIAHRAHESLVGPDGMGEPWFFEGLAVVVAGQFETDVEPVAPPEYPVYGWRVRQLAGSHPMKGLIEHAGERCVLEPGPHGTILMIHGSGPFDLDGRCAEGRYSKEPFFRDLAAAFREEGWGTLRYSKPADYPGTDLANIRLQLRNLWRFLPEDRPRLVFAWSEGSLHVRDLPVDGAILVGGIGTNIGDVIRAQGGPDRDALKREFGGRDRREMIGIDRPVGRLLDELDLEDNGKALRGVPLLVLHGTADAEVPVEQASRFEGATVVLGEGLDHRFGGARRIVDAAREWLTQRRGARAR